MPESVRAMTPINPVGVNKVVASKDRSIRRSNGLRSFEPLKSIVFGVCFGTNNPSVGMSVVKSMEFERRRVYPPLLVTERESEMLIAGQSSC